jgi:hypothetical protein
MIIIKVYTPLMVSLLTLYESAVDGVEYRRSLKEVGDASFTVRTDDDQITMSTIQHYNKVEIYDDGNLEWFGYIAQKSYSLNTINIRCKEVSGLMKKRVVGDALTINGDVATGVASVIDTMNGVGVTGITKGYISGTESVNVTFNKETVWNVLKKLAELANMQMLVNVDGSLDFLPDVGADLSASITFKYNEAHLQSANILSFNIDDDAEGIVNKSYTKSSGYTSTQSDATLITNYGVIEKFENARVVNTQTDLDSYTQLTLRDSLYTPTLNIRNNIGSFDVGDLIKLEITHKIVVIDDTFQVVEKRVKFDKRGKNIQVRIDSTPFDVSVKISELDSRLALLENKL